MSIGLISRVALALVAVPILTAGYLQPPAQAVPAAHTAELGPPDDRHRPPWVIRAFHSWLPSEGCVSRPAGQHLPTFTTQRFHEFTFCLKGFAPGDAAVLHLVTPDGGTSDWPSNSDDAITTVRSWHWSVEQANAAWTVPGPYTFVVTSAHTALTVGNIDVKPASGPSTFFYFTKTQPMTANAAVIATVGGHRPGSPIYASLYGPADKEGRMKLLEDLPPATANRYGEAVVQHTLQDLTESGHYALLVEPTNTCAVLDDCGEFDYFHLNGRVR